MNMIRSTFAGLSPKGARAKLQVLIFHRVRAIPDPLFPGEIDAQQFDRLCTWVKHWFNVLPLDQAVAQMHSGALPARALPPQPLRQPTAPDAKQPAQHPHPLGR